MRELILFFLLSTFSFFFLVWVGRVVFRFGRCMGVSAALILCRGARSSLYPEDMCWCITILSTALVYHRTIDGAVGAHQALFLSSSRLRFRRGTRCIEKSIPLALSRSSS